MSAMHSTSSAWRQFCIPAKWLDLVRSQAASAEIAGNRSRSNRECGMNKLELRHEFKRRRTAIPPHEHAEACARINERLLALPAIQSTKIILSYVAHGTEVNNRAALRELLSYGKRVLMPASRNPDEALHCFHDLVWDDPFLTGQFPVNHTPLLCDFREISAIDLFIVPGIAWDESGYRVGYGGGYFDRLLAQRRADSVLIGLAFEVQITGPIPRDSWDIAVDFVVTETRVIEAHQT